MKKFCFLLTALFGVAFGQPNHINHGVTFPGELRDAIDIRKSGY